jgi:contactin associated protein-like 2
MWHTVHVERNLKQAYLRIDNFNAVYINEPADTIPLHLDLTQPLVVGATVDYKNGFVGCMRGLRVNGVLQDMRGAVHNGQFTYGVHEGLFCRAIRC